jgi:hypothetical protein
MIKCTGTLLLPDRHPDPTGRADAPGGNLQAGSDFQRYTVARQDPGFIHQHLIDMYTAQHGGGSARDIMAAFPDRVEPCTGERIYGKTGAGVCVES